MNGKSTGRRKSGFRQALDGALERLGEELDNIAEAIRRGLQPEQPQPVPIPIPVRDLRRRR